ncbi:MAG TPA: cellulase family glycosylhydrolase [Gaiellaceae bacterium]|nr:cellulase family glycosylhydrolase [Gaiellaceae bacterium]
MRKRLIRLTVASALAAVAFPIAASASPRMLIGFQDDPSFRWRDDRAQVFDLAQQSNAGILRTTVYWSQIAQTRPARATNPFDSAYHFDDLDEFVRNAGQHGMEVMLTIWGTPAWANGGKGQNYAPTSMSSLQNFARAVASRYSGRYQGLPFVRYFTVWNESNLGLFLSPQYDAKGKPVAPRTYARMFRAAYAGIKAGNPRALVGIGETSARGRDRFLGRKGTQETESPGRFAELLSQQRPRLKFDAWSQHPYPTDLRQKPLQKVRWPNVTLSQLDNFGHKLDKWFGRNGIPIWITEYGYQTRPENPKGVSYATQAAYARQVLNIAAANPRVKMFIWFILRDDPTSAWKSGLVKRDGPKKPAFGSFAALAKRYDGRSPQMVVRVNARNPVVRFAALELWSRSGRGAKVGMTVAVYRQFGKQPLKLVTTYQPESTIGYDGWVSFRVPITAEHERIYYVNIVANDVNGDVVNRSVVINVKG